MVYQINSRQDTLIKTKGEFIDESEQSVVSSIKMLGANIEHSARNNYRPYLMLYGEITAVAFPNGRFQPFAPSTQVHVRYEFPDDELAQLSNKGLFYDGFKCPEIISDNPNIEIPMKAVAKRYALMDNIYVTLDLASADIYTTNTQECGYVFADYFESQIPSKLDTKAIEPEEDVIPTFDEDFAAQFASEFADEKSDEDTLVNDEEMAKEAVQAEHQQSLITAEAQKLLEKSPTAKRERDKAKVLGEKQNNIPNLDTSDDLPESIAEDDEFADFRKAQQEFNNKKTHKPILPPSDNDMANFNDITSDSNEDADSDTKEEAEIEKEIKEAEEKDLHKRVAASDASVSVSVSDTDGKEYDEDFGNAFGEDLDSLFESKDDVEKALKDNMSIKHNSNPQKLVTPDDDHSDTNDYSIV